ncbi:MAG: hypothetical protein JW725_05640 [Candidatus Babeliaceae bacterium]|nr:hypothetical protein [Candidatus Babeliaceae bacterium]
MQLIRCTKKLLYEMGFAPNDVEDWPDTVSRLGDWYANLIYIERKKCALYVNGRTLLNFLVPGVKRADFCEAEEFFQRNFQKLLAYEGIPQETIKTLLEDCGQIRFAPTKSKSVLGSMNDIALNYRYEVMRHGGPEHSPMDQVMHELNRMPMMKLKFTLPIDELKAVLQLKHA